VQCAISASPSTAFTQLKAGKDAKKLLLSMLCCARLAEIAGEYLRKGRPIFIEGRLQMDSWDDKQTGQKRTKLRVVGESMQLLGGRPGGAAGETAEEDRSAGGKTTAPPKSATSAEPDDEIPF
jgi:single-strand DNA-binding protein